MVPTRADSADQLTRWIYLLGGGSYPVWHLLGPPNAIDPWWIWWAIGAAFASSAGRALWVGGDIGKPSFYWPSYLVAVHLFTLAALNHFDPFYLIASIASVITTIFYVSDRRALLGYTGLIALLSGSLFFLGDSKEVLYYGFAVISLLAYGYISVESSRRSMEVRVLENRGLAKKVSTRTRQLEGARAHLRREILERRRLEDESRVAQRMEAVGRMAGGFAHEFNNQLMTIRLFAGLLRTEIEDPRLQDDVDRILRTTEQGARLTKEILALSRQSNPIVSVVDLNDRVQAQLPVIERLMPENVSTVCRLRAETSLIRVDEDGLDQILVNLALNARDAMPQGGTLTLESAEVDVPGLDLPAHSEISARERAVVLTVSDTGKGIDPEDQARIFDPFFTTKSGAKGTGMGLSVVWTIVTQHGGHVRVHSERGAGTRFELYWLPARASEVVKPKGEETVPAPVASGERVLLVEDDIELRTGLGRYLRMTGYQVAEARDAEEALDLLEKGTAPFDLLVTDVIMPGIDGLELIHRAGASHPGMRAILLSGQLNGDSSQESPGVPFLRKPFSPEKLLGVMRDVLGS
jgi:signal transduction histidine kinase